MKIAEIIPSTDQHRLNALKRNAASAKQAERRERFRQAMEKYRQRLQARKPGSPAPEPPNRPDLLKRPRGTLGDPNLYRCRF